MYEKRYLLFLKVPSKLIKYRINNELTWQHYSRLVIGCALDYWCIFQRNLPRTIYVIYTYLYMLFIYGYLRTLNYRPRNKIEPSTISWIMVARGVTRYFLETLILIEIELSWVYILYRYVKLKTHTYTLYYMSQKCIIRMWIPKYCNNVDINFVLCNKFISFMLNRITFCILTITVRVQ